MKITILITLLLLSVSANCHALQTIEDRIKAIQYHPPLKTPADYKAPVQIYFHTSDYSAMACTDPHSAVDANIIVSGMPVVGQPEDGDWLQKEKSVGNCWQQPPSVKFMTTQAIAVYAGDFGIEWVAGIVNNKTKKVVGYIPVTELEFIQLPTL